MSTGARALALLACLCLGPGQVAGQGGTALAPAVAVASNPTAAGTTSATPAATPATATSGAPAASTPTYRFRAPAAGAAPQLGRLVLTDEERVFIAALPELRVGLARAGFVPFEVIDADGQISGIHPEMLVSLAHAFGLKIKPVVFDTWSQTLAAAKAHEVDVLMSMGVTTERAAFLEFTLGATPTASALFARKHGGKPTAAPEGAVFAIERGYMANTYVQRRFPQATILAVDSTADALKAVAAGQADYYSGSLLPATDWLSRLSLPGLEVNQLMSYGSGHYHFAVRKDWARLATILNKGISNLRGAHAPQLHEALAKLPAALAPPPTKLLTQAQAAVLIERPVWRVGAVRGLVLLNDFDAQGKHSGIGAEYIEAVARHYGVGLQVQGFESVAAMLDALRSGLVDVVPFLTRTDERAAEFAYSEPYVEMPYLIVARSDAPLYWDLSSLRGKRLALAAQHPLRPVLARKYADIRIIDVPSGSGAMDAVARGQADAAVEVKFFANLRILADNDGQLRTAAVVSDLSGHFHFATSPAAKALVPLINEALADIAQAERLRMLRRWVAQDVTPAFPWRRHAPTLAVGAAAVLLLMAATAWWMRRLQGEVSARRASEERLHDVGATLPCVAFRDVFDAQGRLSSSYVSPGAEAFLGTAIDPAKTMLQNIAPRLRPEDSAAANAALQASLSSGARIKATGQYDHPDGRGRWLHTEAVTKPASDGGRSITGYVVDVSPERDLQARLLQAERARHLLLASASHELRAPAHTLSLALQALAPSELSAGQSAHLRVARDAARNLSQLLNEVLDTARLDQGGRSQGEQKLRPQAFALRDMVEELDMATRAWTRDKGLEFTCTVAPDLPLVVLLDPMRLRQVATNLLSNAVKYTARGGVSLGLAYDGSDAQRPLLLIDVVDSGVGISAQRLQQVFTPYVAAEGGAPVPEGSTGLGLSVCHRLVTQMGGEITLHSQPGAGTRAQLRVPLLPAREPVPPGPVLVCDDDDISRTLLVQMLSLRGYETIEASGGAEALQRWRLGGVHALITDLDMAGMPGMALIDALRADEATARAAGDTKPSARVLVCSGSLVPEAGLEATPAQHDAYLAKPVDMAVLVATLAAIGVPPTHALALAGA